MGKSTNTQRSWDDDVFPDRHDFTDGKWICHLKRYQAEIGFASVPRPTHPVLGGALDWINYQRGWATLGIIPLRIVVAMARLGIRVDRYRSHRERGLEVERESFLSNLAILGHWVRDATRNCEVNLTYAAATESEEAGHAYRFLGNMRRKAMDDTLLPSHRDMLVALPLRVGGKPMELYIPPSRAMQETRMPTHAEMRQKGKLPLVGDEWKLVTPEAADVEQRGMFHTIRVLYIKDAGFESIVEIRHAADRLWVITSGGSGRRTHCYVAAAICKDMRAAVWELYTAFNAKPQAVAIFRMPGETIMGGIEKAARRRNGPDTGIGKPLDTGARFGSLVILGPEPRPDGATRSGHFFRCRCDCGQVAVKQRDQITTRLHPTCGCSAKDNLAGKVFGRLTVTPEVRRLNDGGRNTEWKTRCKCGAEAWIRASALKSGKTRSCGCLRRDWRKSEPAVHNLNSGE